MFFSRRFLGIKSRFKVVLQLEIWSKSGAATIYFVLCTIRSFDIASDI